jgi:hypothetical protein
VLEPGAVLATGELTSADGKTSGHMVVTARDDGNFDVTMSDLRTSITGYLELGLSAVPLTSKVACRASTFYISFGSVPTSLTQTFLLTGVDNLIRGDPSFLHSVLLVQVAPDPANPNCAESAAAAGTLTWTMPDMRPGLRPVDSGSQKAATGAVTTVDGAPASYAVAPYDVMASIAERFGITVDDLFYLNPTLLPGQKAVAGETLNLSKKLR